MADLKTIQKLNLKLLRELSKNFSQALNKQWAMSPSGEKFFRDGISKTNNLALVACNKDKVIGYLIAYIHKNNTSHKISTYAEIESFFVEEKYRSQQVGSLLFTAFLEWAKYKEIKRLRVETPALNNRAINFYHRCGFTDYDLALERKI